MIINKTLKQNLLSIKFNELIFLKNTEINLIQIDWSVPQPRSTKLQGIFYSFCFFMDLPFPNLFLNFLGLAVSIKLLLFLLSCSTHDMADVSSKVGET